MVRSNAAHHPILNGTLERRNMLFCPQRRQHLITRIEIAQQRIVEQKMVRRHTARNIHTLFPRIPYHLNRTRRTHRRYMKFTIGIFGNENISGHRNILGHIGDAVRTEHSADNPLVHNALVHNAPVHRSSHGKRTQSTVIF